MKSNVFSSFMKPQEAEIFFEFSKRNLKSNKLIVSQLKGGRNSLILKVTSSETHDSIILKSYVSHKPGTRDRLQSELDALLFLNKFVPEFCPTVVDLDKENRILALEYIEGQKVFSENIDSGLVFQVADFVLSINKSKDFSQDFLPAAEAFFSLSDVVVNINQRLERLESVKGQHLDHEGFQQFLVNFRIQKKEIVSRLRSNYLDFDSNLPDNLRILSPSDIGFHNTILKKNGQLCFIDFEYFGWDDPSKLISDFILQPEFKLDEKFAESFTNQIVLGLSAQSWLTQRCKVAKPLFALKWCMILLNEFLQDGWARRLYSGSFSENLNDVRGQQLKKAEKMLKKSQALLSEAISS